MNSVKLSIIIPVYNTEDYVERCLNSVLNMYFNYEYEVIVIDNGSKDSCSKILREYKNLFKNFTIFSFRENVGYSGAINKGIELSKGKYIAFIDSDDCILKYFFNDLVFDAELHDADICRSQSFIVYREGFENDFSSCLHVEKSIILSPKDVYKLLSTNVVAMWNCIYKREFLLQFDCRHDSEIPIWTDVLFVLKTILLARNIVISNVVGYVYTRDRITQTAQKITSEKKDILLKIFNGCVEFVTTAKLETSLSEQAKLWILSNASVWIRKLIRDKFFISKMKAILEPCFSKCYPVSTPKQSSLLSNLYSKNISFNQNFQSEEFSLNTFINFLLKNSRHNRQEISNLFEISGFSFSSFDNNIREQLINYFVNCRELPTNIVNNFLNVNNVTFSQALRPERLWYSLNFALILSKSEKTYVLAIKIISNFLALKLDKIEKFYFVKLYYLNYELCKNLFRNTKYDRLISFLDKNKIEKSHVQDLKFHYSDKMSSTNTLANAIFVDRLSSINSHMVFLYEYIVINSYKLDSFDEIEFCCNIMEKSMQLNMNIAIEYKL